MKIRFRHRNLKILVTRISGMFNICKSDGTWDKKLTRGSFKVTEKPIYDKILEQITEIQDQVLYELESSGLQRQAQQQVPLALPAIRVNAGLRGGYENSLPAYIVFEISNGIVIDVSVKNPSIKPPIKLRSGNIYFYAKKGQSIYGYLKVSKEELNEILRNVTELK